MDSKDYREIGQDIMKGFFWGTTEGGVNWKLNLEDSRQERTMYYCIDKETGEVDSKWSYFVDAILRCEEKGGLEIEEVFEKT